MNRNLYFLGTLFLGLSVVAGLWQSIITLQIGGQIYFLDSFTGWFIGVSIVSLAGSLILLKYYSYKNYWFAFFTLIIAAIASFCLFFIMYKMLVARQLEEYYMPVLLLSLGTGAVYAISLIFSKAGKRTWLKTAGCFMFVINLILISVLIWHINSQDVGLKDALEKMSQWISMAGSLVPVLFILNFLSEVKLLNTEEVNTTGHKVSESLLSVVGLSALGFTFGFGLQLASESSSSVYWGKRIFEQTQEMAELFEARTFVSSKGDTLLYRLLKPLDYDPQKKYPMVLSLPYGGQPGTDKIRQIEGAAAAQLLSSDMNRRKYPAFLFIPNCPAGAGWGGIPNYPTVDSLVFEAIDALQKQEPGIDVKRCYVTGISRGGYGSWHFISIRPDMFAAAIPVCGGGDPKLAPNIVDVSIWAFHGAKDRNVPVNGSRDMIAAIKKAGGNPRYTEFPDAHHNIWEEVKNTPGLLDWLFAQKRE